MSSSGRSQITKATVLGRRHRLTDHLPDLKTVSADVGIVVSQDLEQYVRDMHQYDPNSQHWRYPEVRAGGTKAAPSEGTKEIDPQSFVVASESAFVELSEILTRLYEERNNEILMDLGIKPWE